MSLIHQATTAEDLPVSAGASILPASAGRRAEASSLSGGRRVRRGAQRVGQLLALSYLTVLIGLVFWSDAPMAMGWHPQLVLTGSMVPAVSPGDVVLTAKVSQADVQLGNIVLGDDSNRPGSTYLHRVVRRDKANDLVTKGDANPSQDYPSLKAEALRGRAQLVVPAIGRPVLWMRQGRWVPAGLVAGGTLLACFLAFSAPLTTAGPEPEKGPSGMLGLNDDESAPDSESEPDQP